MEGDNLGEPFFVEINRMAKGPHNVEEEEQEEKAHGEVGEVFEARPEQNKTDDAQYAQAFRQAGQQVLQACALGVFFNPFVHVKRGQQHHHKKPDEKGHEAKVAGINFKEVFGVEKFGGIHKEEYRIQKIEYRIGKAEGKGNDKLLS